MKNILHSNQEELLSLGDVCRMLSISRATAKNWIKLGKMVPDGNDQMFTRAYIDHLEKQLRSGENHRLKNRRNKKSISGKSLYRDYISHVENQQTVAKLLETDREFGERELRVILANFAVQFYLQSQNQAVEQGLALTDFLDKEDCEGSEAVFQSLVAELLGPGTLGVRLLGKLSDVMNCRLQFVPGEDTLGFVYLSLRDVNQRKTTGAYYTPAVIVNRLLEDLKAQTVMDHRTICDPCCGTGNFLMELAAGGVKAENLYGQDLDPLSVLLVRINIVLLCPEASLELLRSHFICGNTLFHTFLDKFDIVLGNPPWGYAFSKEETSRLRKLYVTAKGKGMESFDLFLERSLSMLAEGGILAFILPEAVLSVASHQPVRQLLLQQTSFRFVTYLGNVFAGVQCPAVVLGVCSDGQGETVGCRVSGQTGGQPLDYVVLRSRAFEDGVFSFNITDEEAACIETIDQVPGALYLEGNAQFALGIVTGDNKEKVKKFPEPGYETVLKGSDISRYAIHPSGNYLKFDPRQFQQVAPEEYYRAPEKLLYRFISEVPVFAYDNRQTLTLNSCNIVIPQLEGVKMKYVLAILNSSVAAFYLAKRFHSVKLLRSHIERLPIPAVSEEIQQEIISMVDDLMEARENIRALYDRLDRRVMELYGLGENKRKVILDVVGRKNQFLPLPEEKSS